MDNFCKFIELNDNSKKCNHHCKYGDFCYKHRGEYLMINNTINIDIFTGLSKDYLKKDLIIFMKDKMRKKPIISDKQSLFNEVNNFIMIKKLY